MFLKLGSVFFLAAVVLWLWAIFDSLTTDRRHVRNLPKVVWVLIVLVFFWLGALAWAFLGRPTAASARAVGNPPARGQTSHFPTPGSGFRRPGRGTGSGGGSAGGSQAPRGPDDDPDFLRGL